MRLGRGDGSYAKARACGWPAGVRSDAAALPARADSGPSDANESQGLPLDCSSDAPGGGDGERYCRGEEGERSLGLAATDAPHAGVGDVGVAGRTRTVRSCPGMLLLSELPPRSGRCQLRLCSVGSRRGADGGRDGFGGADEGGELGCAGSTHMVRPSVDNYPGGGWFLIEFADLSAESRKTLGSRRAATPCAEDVAEMPSASAREMTRNNRFNHICAQKPGGQPGRGCDMMHWRVSLSLMHFEVTRLQVR